MNQYNALVLDHFWRPRNVGQFTAHDSNIFTGVVGTAGIGDVLQLQLKIEKQHITAAKFKAYGNPYIIAGCSLASETLLGLTIVQAQTIQHDVFVKALNLPQTKLYCALLIEDVIKNALQQYANTQQAQILETSDE